MSKTDESKATFADAILHWMMQEWVPVEPYLAGREVDEDYEAMRADLI